MKRVLLVVQAEPINPESMNWHPLRDAIQDELKSADIQVDMTSLTSLVFDISAEKVAVKDTLTGKDVADYDLVVIRKVGAMLELGITLAHYLRLKNVPFTDTYLDTNGAGKLACAMKRRRFNLPTPRTIYGKAEQLTKYLEEVKFAYPFIMKADSGRKGRDNFLVTSKKQLHGILQEYSERAMIIQDFIPNDGDYRALVLGDKIAVVIKRTAGGDSHLTNTSQGGSATLESADMFTPRVKKQILKAAEVEGLQVAGVDVIFDKNTGDHYFLEVNRAPQIGTGAFAEEKIAAYAVMLRQLAGRS